jgi:hypothetical protein
VRHDQFPEPGKYLVILDHRAQRRGRATVVAVAFAFAVAVAVAVAFAFAFLAVIP